MSTTVWSFVLVVGLVTIAPGVDSALVLRTAALGRRRRAWGVVLGIQTGTLLWGTLTSLGLTALLTASRLAYDTLRWAGAAYLLWLGARMLHATLRRTADHTDDTQGQAPAPDNLAGGWRQGVLTNLLNPKVGVFYVAVLPQFIPPGAPHLATGILLACVHVVLGTAWSAALIAFAHALRGWFARPAARRILDRVTGTVLIAFGLRLVATD